MKQIVTDKKKSNYIFTELPISGIILRRDADILRVAEVKGIGSNDTGQHSSTTPHSPLLN